ncbi:hypothetical protein MMC18_001321 [Xylographa bjoerkii]|nr:hypothetical protein [Xylographa bjoerkii]
MEVDMDCGQPMMKHLPDPEGKSIFQSHVEEVGAHPQHSQHGKLLGIAALILNVVLVAFLIAIVFVDINLTSVGSLSSTARALYVTGTTILASLCTYLTASQIRMLWLRRVDKQLYNGKSYEKADPFWRTVLGISSISENLQYWNVSLTFLVCGLTTTAVVAGLASSPNSYQIVQNYALADSNDYHCANVESSNPEQAGIWTLHNGSFYQVWVNLDFCPTSLIMSLMGSVNVIDSSNYGYADLGVAIHPSALGAPASIYSSQTTAEGAAVTLWLNETLDTYKTDLLSTSQCVPVLTANPIQCARENNITFSSDGYLTITSSDGCTAITYPGLGALNTTESGWSASGICAHGDIGTATIVLGGLLADAGYAAEAIGDITWIKEWDAGSVPIPKLYGISCTVDTASVIDTRNVTLTLLDNSGNTDSFARSLSAQDLQSCTPISLSGGQDPVSDKLLATAAMGPWQLLNLGALEILRSVLINPAVSQLNNDHTIYVRQPPFAFNNSRNALEDIFGLSSALAMSRLTLTGSTGQADYAGTAMIANTRVGTGERWALVYVLPPLISSLVLLALLLTTSRQVPFTASKLTDLAAILNHHPRTPIPPPPDLPRTQCDLDPHAHPPGDTHAGTITHTRGTQTELPALGVLAGQDLGEGVHVDQAAEQALPEDEGEDPPDAGQEGEQALQDEQEQIEALEEGGRVQAVDAHEGGRGAGEEDAGLVDELVGGVEGAVGGEGGGGEGEEERGGHALVDGVFGDVDEQEGEHAVWEGG